MEIPQSRIDAVRRGEEAMARRIALAYQVARPISLWGALIPGKFVYDAVRRNREVRWARDRFLPPREAALARAARGEAETPAGGAGDDDTPRDRLVGRLARHYARLLAGEGKTYAELVKTAYPNPAELEAEWAAIGELEAEVDDLACWDRPGDDPLAERLRLYREHAREQRRRAVQELYYA